MRQGFTAALAAAGCFALLGASAPAQAQFVYYGPPGPYAYGYYGYYGGPSWGGPVAAGAAGLAAGALIGGAIASRAQPPEDPRWVASCSRRYRTFDPASGTYLAADGRRYVCQ